MSPLELIMLERARHAEAVCNDRVSSDLERLGGQIVQADTRLGAVSARSLHSYCCVARIRVLESVQETNFEPYTGLTGGPHIELCAEDYAQYCQAVRDILLDQFAFAHHLVGSNHPDESKGRPT